MRKLYWKTWSTGSKWSYLPTRIAPIESLFDKKGNDKDGFPSNGSKLSTHHDGIRPSQYLNHTDIKQRAIQVLYTEGARGGEAEGGEHRWWYIKVIHPNKPFRRIFDVMTVIWVLYLVFFIPLEIGFSWFVASSRQKKFLSFLDVWFAVDFILNFRTGYICHGTVIMDQKRIIWNYLRTWFTVDLLGTFPFERLINSRSSSRKSLKLIKYFKIPKLLRISRLMKYIRVHKHMYDIFQVLVLVLTCLHVGACVWMAILSPCIDDRENYAGDDFCSQDRVYSLYAEAFHLSTAMILGVSNMNIISKSSIMDMLTYRREESRVAMYVISSLFMVGGLVLISLLIGEMNVYLMGIMQGSAAFQRKIDRVNHEMEYYAIPIDLQRQVRAFYDYVWIHQKQFDDKIALLSDENMSTDLQRKLALHMYKDVVSHISIFSGIDDLVLGEICLSLRTRIFLPRDMIICKGDIGKELFIIAKGVVEVLRDDLPPDKKLHAPPIMLQSGSFFGEIALIMEVRRTCSVQARTICEVNLLDQKAFDSILRDNPEFARRMNELVVVRQLERTMTKNSRKGVDYEVSKDDYDRAYDAVSKQMKEGLERRMKQSSNTETLHSRPTHNLDETCENKSCSHNHDEVSSDENSVSSVKSEGRRRSLHRNRSSASSNVTQIMADITRRSTRFVNETSKPMMKIVHTNSCCSEGEMDMDRRDPPITANTNKTSCIGKRRRRSMLDFSGEPSRPDFVDRPLGSNGKEYETMQAAGHFNPDQSVVDIQKVHPSILNRGGTVAHPSCEGKMKVLGARFEAHDAFMSKLLKKLEKIESWLCINSNRGNGASRGARSSAGNDPSGDPPPSDDMGSHKPLPLLT